MKMFYYYLLQNKWLTFGVLLLILLASIFAQITPYIQGLIVDNAIGSQSQNALVTLIVALVFILLLDTISKYYLNIIMTNKGYNVASKIRKNIFITTVNRPLDFFEKNNNGDIILRTNFYIHNIGSYISNSISNMVIGVGRFLIIYAFMFVLNYKLAFVLTGLYLIVFLVIYLFSKKLIKLGNDLRDKELHRNSLILENLEGVETYLAYNDNFKYLTNYNTVNKAYDKIRYKYYFIYNCFDPIIEFLVSLGTVIIYLLTLSVELSVLEIGVVVAMLTYANRIIEPMQKISTGLASSSDTRSVLEKVFGLDSKNNNYNQYKINYEKINIRCQNVCYKNSMGANINNICIEIPFKQKILIVGPYGIGKTTFTHLLMGLYKLDSGEILFNEVNINNINKESLSQMISVACDDVGIFYGTVYQNVKFAKPTATDKEIKNAIKLAGLNPFVKSLKNKEQTKISEKVMSEGDKQLIAFARLILKNTPIIIIDEFVRDLSLIKQKKFLNNLQKFCKDKTLIYISQNTNVDFKFDKKIFFKKLNNINN